MDGTIPTSQLEQHNCDIARYSEVKNCSLLKSLTRPQFSPPALRVIPLAIPVDENEPRRKQSQTVTSASPADPLFLRSLTLHFTS